MASRGWYAVGIFIFVHPKWM